MTDQAFTDLLSGEAAKIEQAFRRVLEQRKQAEADLAEARRQIAELTKQLAEARQALAPEATDAH